MSRSNNFGRLGEDDEARFEGSRIQENLWQTFGIFRFVGEIAEVYFSKMVEVIIAAAGGKSDGTSSSATPSSTDRPIDPGKNAPGN